MATNANMEIKCVMDSSFSPQSRLVEDIDCGDAAAEIDQYAELGVVPDLSCLDGAGESNTCLE